jgi:hypothetical protein
MKTKEEIGKYETKACTVFSLPDNPLASKVEFFDVSIALGSWDETEDAEDASIFYYMDGEPLAVGTIVSNDFVVVHMGE